MKKTLAIVLAAALALGMAVTGFAATPKITSISSDALVDESGYQFSLYDEELRPGQIIEIYLNEDAFDISNATSKTVINTSLLSSSSVDVKKTVSKGSDLIEKVEFANKTINGEKRAYIKVELVDTFASTSSKDLDMRVYLTLKNSRKAEAQISGSMENDVVEVTSDDAYIYIGEGQVAEAIDYIKEIEVDIGNGVIINAKMYANKKYYGTCEMGIKEEDDKVVTRYPEIEEVLRLTTVNLKGSGKIVKIDTDETYHVYNKEGNYVGTTDSKLTYSDLYYLATEKIKISNSSSKNDDEDYDDEDYDDSSSDYVEEDDDSSYSSTTSNNYYTNDNPSTGVSGAVGGAIALGIVAAVSLVLLSRKK